MLTSPLIAKLSGFVVRQAFGVAVDNLEDVAQHFFLDHGEKLPRALKRANLKTWQSLSIAIGGDGVWNRLKGFFAGADAQGVADQVRQFLAHTKRFEGLPADFRQGCLRELELARKAEVLTFSLTPKDFARETSAFERYTDPAQLIVGADRLMIDLVKALAGEYPNLGKLLKPAGDPEPPFVVAAFSFFFRREVENDEELAHGLFFDGLRQLSASLAKGFVELQRAMDRVGDQLDSALSDLAEMKATLEAVDTKMSAVQSATESMQASAGAVQASAGALQASAEALKATARQTDAGIRQTLSTATATHGAVLDVQSEMQRLGQENSGNFDEVRRLLQDLGQRLQQANMQRGEVKPHHSMSIRNDDERRAVRDLLQRYRQLPVEQQQQTPALRNGIGKLQLGAGDFAGARESFDEVTTCVADPTSKAEAAYNSYRAALEQKQWEPALASLLQAVQARPERFSPFPLQRYEPRRILGAGGFGTAFLCHDRFFGSDVVLKTFHHDAIQRSMTEVFREAQLLKALQHPSIIGVRDCNYADLTSLQRPYIVMDYFPGVNLREWIATHGPLTHLQFRRFATQVAEGMAAAHRQNILHRDLKPDNILLKADGEDFSVKIIDFGLALSQQAVETSQARGSKDNTLWGDSVAGTIEYASPEQMGRLDTSLTGPASDIFSFGKTCNYALFQTTEPKRRHLTTLPDLWAEMLEKCTEFDPKLRFAEFGEVLKVISVATPAKGSNLPPLPTLKSLPTEKVTEKLGSFAKGMMQSLGNIIQPSPKTRERLKEEVSIPEVVPIEDAPRAKKSVPSSTPKPGPKGPPPIPGLSTVAPAVAVVAQVRLVEDSLEARKPGEFFTNALGMRFAWIPPGNFLMGSPPDEPGHTVDEFYHSVRLSQGFFLGVHQVTQDQWKKVMRTDPSQFKGGKLPVDSVSWNHCVSFCRRLSEMENQTYRLPTEAEWEYACRAGTMTPFAFGQSLSSQKANFDVRSHADGKSRKSLSQTRSSEGVLANGWNLCEMHGNLWEWCSDWFGSYPQKEQVDPTGPLDGTERVLRGGAWNSPLRDCRSARRHRASPNDADSSFGFRVVVIVG